MGGTAGLLNVTRACFELDSAKETPSQPREPQRSLRVFAQGEDRQASGLTFCHAGELSGGVSARCDRKSRSVGGFVRTRRKTGHAAGRRYARSGWRSSCGQASRPFTGRRQLCEARPAMPGTVRSAGLSMRCTRHGNHACSSPCSLGAHERRLRERLVPGADVERFSAARTILLTYASPPGQTGSEGWARGSADEVFSPPPTSGRRAPCLRAPGVGCLPG